MDYLHDQRCLYRSLMWHSSRRRRSFLFHRFLVLHLLLLRQLQQLSCFLPRPVSWPGTLLDSTRRCSPRLRVRRARLRPTRCARPRPRSRHMSGRLSARAEANELAGSLDALTEALSRVMTRRRELAGRSDLTRSEAGEVAELERTDSDRSQ